MVKNKPKFLRISIKQSDLRRACVVLEDNAVPSPRLSEPRIPSCPRRLAVSWQWAGGRLVGVGFCNDGLFYGERGYSYLVDDLEGKIACDIWLRELALRRCIWCWYAERPESMGMWNNYGYHGVAIVSKVKNVRDALSLPDDALSSVAKVVYLPLDDDAARLRIPHDSVTFERPYYIKQEAYKYENEIRIVLACEPLRTSLKGGVLLQVNPKLLIEEVVISPHMWSFS